MISGQISVVLMRPKGGFNIGASARAMNNMGVDRLILVAPEIEIDVRAREGAASAQAVLARRIVYDTLEEFYAAEGSGLRLAFTRRDGLKRPAYDFGEYVEKDLAPKLKAEFSETPIYLIFGAEDDGLSAEEVELANRCVSLPVFGENCSYNLSQAVLVALLILQTELKKQGLVTQFEPGREVAREPADFPKGLIQEWLTTLGFDLGDRRKSAADIINVMLLRCAPTPDELKLLSGIFHQSIRKLKEYRASREPNGKI